MNILKVGSIYHKLYQQIKCLIKRSKDISANQNLVIDEELDQQMMSWTSRFTGQKLD